MSDAREPTREELAALQASMDRLAKAGLIEILEYDAASDRGVMSFHPAYHRLLMSGRNPLLEEGFARPLAAGDLAAAREWIEREGASPQGEAAAPGDSERTNG